MPFTIGIQTEWQRQMMLKHGHRGGISVDATFGTNEKKFPLYTLMVFDEWHSGVPVAFILTSKCAEANLSPWLKALNAKMEKGFVDNKKMQDKVVDSILKARLIPDTDVTLPVKDGDTAMVTSTTHRHMRYTVYNPGSEWGVCNCVWLQRGNMCKHHVKVVMMMHPDISEGTVARYCGRMAGNVNGGLQQLLTPRRVQTAAPVEFCTPLGENSLDPVTLVPTPQRRREVDLPETLRQQIITIHEEVVGDSCLMEHLVAELNQTIGRLRKLKVERRDGTLRPMIGSPIFETINDGMGFKLRRRKDFLECSGPRLARRL